MTKRALLGLFIRGYGYHRAAWRRPAVPAGGTLYVERNVRSVQIAERAKMNMIFFANGAGNRRNDMPKGALAGSGCVELVIPKLRCCGLLRGEFEAATLRCSLGLKPAVNRYAQAGKAAAE